MFIILFSTLIALCFFYYMEQKRRVRNEKRQEGNKEKLEELLNVLRRRYVSGNDIERSEKKDSVQDDNDENKN